MDFRVLDASAFYAGVPFGSPDSCYTTPLIYDEIRHIKKSHDALGVLVETGRLKIREPDMGSVKTATSAARKTGDYVQLSEQDISVIALSLDIGGYIITDDFAISNVAGSLGIKTSPVMTGGIKNVGEWVHYCPGCKKDRKVGKECAVCGTTLRRRFARR